MVDPATHFPAQLAWCELAEMALQSKGGSSRNAGGSGRRTTVAYPSHSSSVTKCTARPKTKETSFFVSSLQRETSPPWKSGSDRMYRVATAWNGGQWAACIERGQGAGRSATGRASCGEGEQQWKALSGRRPAGVGMRSSPRLRRDGRQTSSCRHTYVNREGRGGSWVRNRGEGVSGLTGRGAYAGSAHIKSGKSEPAATEFGCAWSTSLISAA